jgi:uncharacterized RDD family membrane protein YckC
MTTPEDPFQPPADGTPPPPPPQYGAPPPPPPQWGGPPPQFPGSGGYPAQPLRTDYASWGLRVGSALIDYFALGILAGVFILAHVLVVGYLIDFIALVWALYNAYQAGQTGQSYGKKMVGTKLIREADGNFIGGGAGIGRYFVHILDGIPCYLGFLWPLWDDKKQTFADKLMGTIVVKA